MSAPQHMCEHHCCPGRTLTAGLCSASACVSLLTRRDSLTQFEAEHGPAGRLTHSLSGVSDSLTHSDLHAVAAAASVLLPPPAAAADAAGTATVILATTGAWMTR